MTKNRQKILQLIEEENGPLNAQQLFTKMNHVVDLATVYRGLQFLENKNLVKSFVYECKERGIERYYYWNQIQHLHYMHCEECHKFIPFSNCPFEKSFKTIETEYGFKVIDHAITLKGICVDCR